MKWYEDSLPSVQTWENGWGKCMRIIIAPFVWVCMIISLSVCFWWLVLMCTVSAMSVHVLECVWLNLHYAIAWCHGDTHTHTVASDTPVHTTSPHEVSDFLVWSLIRAQDGLRWLKKNPPFLRIYIAVYTYIMHVAAWLYMCFDVCAFDRDNRKPQTNNSHSGWQKLCNAQCRYTISAERVPLTAASFPGTIRPDRSTATCQAFIIASLAYM